MYPTRKAPADLDLAGRGLLLIPAIFTWPKVWPRSDHLKILRRAGLVTGCREGRQVIYTRTAKGDTLAN